ncbi:MAG TPA: gamma-glutamyltransferase [Thermoanaerobaculia bacterium]|nr:gamma-glutamyltransferase [Thermoanaerobaculia bacterium]
MTDDASPRGATRETVDPFRDLGEVLPHRPVRPQRFALSRRGMVAAQHWLATQAGVEILEAGGNAIDAAVAAAFALGVCEPQASGLGGQTMAMIHLVDPRRTFALDGSSRAPNRAHLESLRGAHRLRGYRATTVPSTPAVLGHLINHYGRLPLARVLAPAIRLAVEGVPWSELQHGLLLRELRHLRKHNAKEIFLRGGRQLPVPGSLLHQPVLARTLRRLAAEGVEDFYRGRIGRAIVRDMERNGGLIHADDLARIPTPIERRPISTRFRGMRIVTFPPPGAGRALLQMFNILDQFEPEEIDPETARGAVLLALVMHQAAMDRADRPYDPNLYPQIRRRRMLDPDRTRTLARRFRRSVRGGGETTHLSVMDRDGNVVALTQSIERVFGAMVATPELGFLYNDYLSAYDVDDMAHPYYLRPNTPPWGSVAPTIAFRGARPTLAIGSPGSDRIVTAILQVMLRLRTLTPFESVDAPRLHATLEGKVALEATRFRDDIPALLESHGFTVDRRDPYSFYMGSVQMVQRTREGFVGVADPRRDGSAAGPKA